MKKTLKKMVGPQTLRAYHAAKSHLAATLAGKPAQDMTVIGVTGTNGKTTTCNIIAAIFEEAGRKVALCTTIQFRINGHEEVNELKMTAPNPFKLNQFLKRARLAGCEVLVQEVTSIALDQQRFAGIPFDTGVFTNLTHDHLDYHGTMANYAKAKRKLFARDLRVSVINGDDPEAHNLLDMQPHSIVYTLDTSNHHALRSQNVVQSSAGLQFEVVLPENNEIIPIQSSLVGTFNVSNILAAVGVALQHGIDHATIQKGIASLLSVSGRMERIEMGQDFSVIVDYAHTPDALIKLFEATKPAQPARLIAVLGSCGDRDRSKRPTMGAIAGKYSDFVVFTNEDPYTEDPQSIIDAVASGVTAENQAHKENQTFWRILDRREAIKKAFSLAKPGDVVTISGKGAETAMVFGKQFIPWSDRRIAEEELRSMKRVS